MNDLISRQAAIDFVDAGHLVNPNEPRWSDNEVVNFLKSRPSAQPDIIRCKDCKFYTAMNRKTKKFTNDEKAIARNIDKNYKWIARDHDGNLCVYEGKPEKGMDSWYSVFYFYIPYFNHLFSAIKWEDEEPTLISDIYNPQVLDNAEREYLKVDAVTGTVEGGEQ